MARKRQTDGRVFSIVTYRDKDNLISHHGWEIRTRAAVITNRDPIKNGKTTARNSLVLHCRNFLRYNLPLERVKSKEIQL